MCAIELIATGRDDAAIARAIGADKVIYQDQTDMIEAAREGNPDIARFDSSCFDGVYVTGDVSRGYLQHIEHLRNDSAKEGRTGQGGEIAYAEVLTFTR